MRGKEREREGGREGDKETVTKYEMSDRVRKTEGVKERESDR